MNTKIKYIIGLGNPSEEYLNTRHNIGFMFLDFIQKKTKGQEFEFDRKLNSWISKTDINGSGIALVKPATFVNKTGDLIRALKAKPENIVAVQDDLDIEFGNSKLSYAKNSGGHKGIESIIKALKTKDFNRLRLGIATKGLQKARQQSDKKRDEFVHDFVLAKFTKKESEELKDIFQTGWEKVQNLI